MGIPIVTFVVVSICVMHVVLHVCGRAPLVRISTNFMHSLLTISMAKFSSIQYIIIASWVTINLSPFMESEIEKRCKESDGGCYISIQHTPQSIAAVYLLALRCLILTTSSKSCIPFPV